MGDKVFVIRLIGKQILKACYSETHQNEKVNRQLS